MQKSKSELYPTEADFAAIGSCKFTMVSSFEGEMTKKGFVPFDTEVTSGTEISAAQRRFGYLNH